MTNAPTSVSSRLPRRRRIRAAAALAAAAVMGALLAPVAAQAVDGDDLDISFGGSLVGTTAYTTVEGETMRGVVHRMDGAEEQLPEGVRLAGGTQGIRFDASDATLAATPGFVAEVQYTPTATQAEMATLFSAGGNLFVRVQNGVFTYGFDAQTDTGWVQNRQTTPAPSGGITHAVSVQYVTTDAGADLHLWIDGIAQPTVTATTRAAIHQDLPAAFGFGNEAHPEGGDRGTAGLLQRIRVHTGITAFDPAQFVMQPEPGSRSILNTQFGGALNADGYTAASGDVVDGTLRARGAAHTADGDLVLAGGGDAVDFAPATAPFGDAALDQSFVVEVEFSATTAQADLATLVGVGGNFTARYRSGGLQYGFSTNATGSWVDHMQSVGVPATGRAHILSLAYIVTDGSARVIAWLDGQELPEVGPAALSTRGGDGAVTASFGNDLAHTGDRGFAGTIERARFGLIDGDFRDNAFEFQQKVPSIPCEALGEIAPANFVAVSSADCPANVLAKSALVRPTAQQLEWQELGLTAFVHFGINTFYNQEWGHGTEDPARFDPTGPVDVDSWMKTLRDSGHRMAILTVKHHDGFVLYPSRYTDYDVAASPWQGGQGDLVREFTDAARTYGLEVGLYLSPADSHEELTGRFGNGSPKSPRTIPTLVDGDDRAGQDLPTFTYDATDYGAYFLNSLYEVLTEYGEIDEVWFDGAAGNTAKQELFDYPAFYDLIAKLQPNAVVAVGGRDVRWVGNEHGTARVDEWAPMAISEDSEGGRIGVVAPGSFETTGSATQLSTAVASGDADFLHWWPTESDMKLTPGWFAHPGDVPKSGESLLGHYRDTIGRNSVMLLNTPPTTDGSFAPSSVQSLSDFGALQRRTFTNNVALGATATVADAAVTQLTDGNRRTSWTSQNADPQTVTVDLGQAQPVTSIRLSEGVEVAGQTVEKFTVQAQVGGEWTTVGTAGTIGVSRIVTFAEPVTAQHFRITVDAARAAYALADVSLFTTLAEDPGHLSEVWLDCAAEVAGPGTQERPFSSLEQFREAELAAGATVHLRAGQTCADSTTPFWGYGTADAPITVTLYDGTAAPTFGDRTAAEVFAGLDQQGWVLDLAGAPTLTGHESLASAHRSVKSGAATTLTLSGFAPQATVTLQMPDAAAELGTVTTDAAGAASATVTVPTELKGLYAVDALIADLSAASVTLRVTPTAVGKKPAHAPAG